MVTTMTLFTSKRERNFWLLALGWIDEIIQGFVPGRVYDIRNVGINAAAGLILARSTGERWPMA